MTEQYSPSDSSHELDRCPICGSGPMWTVYRVRRMSICLCLQCQTSISVPDEAWERSSSIPSKLR
jgi:hypothetical protein